MNKIVVYSTLKQGQKNPIPNFNKNNKVTGNCIGSYTDSGNNRGYTSHVALLVKVNQRQLVSILMTTMQR